MSDVSVKLVITPPSHTSPGFAKRLRKAASFQESIIKRELTASVIDELVGFLADYCATEGLSAEETREILWELSEDQFTELLSAVSGGGAQVPPVS